MSKELTVVQKRSDAKNFLVTQLKPVIEDYATRDYNHDKWLKTAMMCIMESEEIQKCLTTKDGQASLVHALTYAAGTGLSLNPQEGKAALIAYSGKVEYQIMKGGMVELAQASGKVKFITADIVYAGDEFDLMKTMNGDTYKFRPALVDRGAVLGYFAALAMNDGTVHVKWIDIANMEDHKARYAKGLTYKDGKEKPGHAWNKSFDGMALKTVLKALLRTVEISPDLSVAVGVDDKFEVGNDEDVIDIGQAKEVRDKMAGNDDPAGEEGSAISGAPKEETKEELF